MEPRDISLTIGPLFPLFTKDSPAEFPMFSYERAAYTFWQGVFNGLLENGLSEAQAFEWLQSKDARYLLDGPTAGALCEFGRQAVLKAKG